LKGSSFGISRILNDVRPLKTSEIGSYNLDKTKYKDCALKKDTYSVRKESHGSSWVFYATTDPNFYPRISDSFDKKYEDQIGYGWCLRGWIKKVEINASPINARGCGISTILSQLCMVDPDINDMGEGNEALKILASNLFSAERKIFVETCKELIGLTMAANPKTGAYAYFSAAIATGFSKMMIQHKKGWDRYVFYPDKGDSAQQTFQDTAKWRKGFNKDTGNIKDEYAPEGEYKLSENDLWYFCKPK
jgi:hypothetical protein